MWLRKTLWRYNQLLIIYVMNQVKIKREILSTSDFSNNTAEVRDMKRFRGRSQTRLEKT